MDRRDYLKPSRFGNAEKRRLLDTKTLKEKRSIRRTTNFNLRRDIDDIVQEVNKKANENIPPKSEKLVDRKLALQKFRAEREAQRKALKSTKKPPFIVGIPHHGSSPLLRDIPNAENTNKKVVKATTTNEFNFQPYKVPQSVKKLTSPHTPTVLKRSVQKKPLKNVSNLVNTLKITLEHLPDDDEVLAAPLASEEVDETGAERGQTAIKTNETLEYTSPPASEAIKVGKKEDEETKNEDEDNELANQVAFQHSRLQSETTRLLELADQWQTVVLRESLPQEVVDEVDSVVGQTRLLTSDKFQQFRRLIVQYEQQTGTHPVTLDDLNGFWDMIYLQVESMDKKYAALDILKNNNWVRPEPAIRKKRRPGKTAKVEKVMEIFNPLISEKPKINLHPPEEDQQIHTPTTNVKPIINSALLNKKRTRSNSPSPYIAMRLSGIGRTSNIMVQPPETVGTPRSKLASAEAYGTPKSALKNSWTRLSGSSRKRTSKLSSTISSIKVKIEEAVEDSEQLTGTEEQLLPAITPRRSMRLITKLSTPATCSACESASCKRSNCTKDSASKKPQNSKKISLFSPSESKQKSDAAPMTEVKEEAPSTSGVRFSLRPSILTVSENNVCEISRKTTKRRQASVFTASTSVEQDSEGLGAMKCRRSSRQSRKVTFEEGTEEKHSFKLPATPYRKLQSDC